MDRARRKLVTAGGAVLAGLIGVGSFGGIGGAGVPETGFHEVGVAAVADLGGTTPAPGQVMSFDWSTANIELLSDGEPGFGRSATGSLDTEGHVYITHAFINDLKIKPGNGSGLVDRIEQHVFVVPDGQIMGLGSVTAGTGSFSVVGGTGRYAKTDGQYTVVFEDAAADGVGPARFSFVLRGTN